MALPRKKTRRITVGSVDFRWGRFGSGTVTEIRAELHDEPASQLVARIEQGPGGESPAVGPGLTAALIQSALDKGWSPEAREPREFVLDDVQALAAEHDLNARKSLTCVVIAPLDAGAAGVRDTLARTVRELGLQVRDVADLPAGESIVAGVTALIDEADLIVADVSRKNPNVYYEIGYAHALGKPTIHVLEESGDSGVPSALAGNLFILYSRDNLTTLRTGLKKAVLRFLRSGASR